MDCSRDCRSTRRGFTLVELLVVISIVILLMAILLPTLGAMQSERRQVVCANNLRNLGLGLAAATRAGHTIESTNWANAILPYVNDNASLLNCPEHGSLATSYGMSNRGHRFGDEDAHRIALLDYHTSEANIVVRDINDQDAWSEDAGTYAARHADRVNVLLHSGSVQARTAESIDPRTTDVWLANWRPHRDTFVISGAVESGNVAHDAVLVNNSSLRPPAAMTSPPDYPPLDPDACGETLVIGDDGDTAIFSHSYDTAYDYTDLPQWLIDQYEASGTPIPYEHVNFRPLTLLPDDATGTPYGGNHHRAEGHQASGGTAATFSFDVDPGRYNVWVHWMGAPSHSDSTPMQVMDGETEVYSTIVNQEMTSEAFAISDSETPLIEDGYGWYPLGEHAISSDQLKVVISAAAGAADHVAGQEHLVVADAVRIECANSEPFERDRCYGEAPDPIDNDAPGYTATAGWTNVVDEDSVGGSHVAAVVGTGDETITYEFNGVTPGQYQVWTHFVPAESQATNAPFTVYDGYTQYSTTQVDQSHDYLGVDLDDDGRQWYKVGEYEIRRQNGIRVVVTDNANGTVVADAVRIVCAFGALECPSGTYGRDCRRDQAEEYGATGETEEAVDNALNWLARHQYVDGSWNYDHQSATCPYIETPEPCNGECSRVGSGSSYPVAATGMALLPFLGAGIGPEHEQYGEVVAHGINYLLAQVEAGGILKSSGADLGGAGYEQGIGPQALVEALGVCRASGFGSVDVSDLEAKVLIMLQRIVGSQHPAGGWRYLHSGDYDMTVTGSVASVLFAADAVAIDVEGLIPGANVMEGLRSLLTELSHEWTVVEDPIFGSYATGYYYGSKWNFAGAGYYNGFGGSFHIGHYLRLATGASPQAAGMLAAADIELARISGGMPAESYKNFYAHQFMHGMGGSHWDTWDAAMVQYLLEDNPQPTTGHVRGSWEIGGSTLTSEACGRLWDTVSATLILQQYYRNATPTGPLVSDPIPGDTDGDGDVDVEDILQAFANFTGPNPEPPAAAFTKTATQGDFLPAETGGDGDVDVEDLLLIMSAFTGPGGG